MSVFRTETSGMSPQGPPKGVLEEDPKTSSTLPWQCLINDLAIDARTQTYALSIEGFSPYINVGAYAPNIKSMSKMMDVQDSVVVPPTVHS